jgi:uncharacterized DUF497 family protein
VFGYEEFDWDDDNIEHIARHGVEPWEAEDAMLDPDRVGASARNVPGERRFAVVGATESGRVLFVVFTRRERGIRVITARDANDSEKRRYRRR